MAKLWDKGYDDDALIDKFTVGKDRELDLYLAQYDILGTMAHITMLESVGLLESEELAKLLPVLSRLHEQAVAGKLVIEPDVEDIHSQVELMLTRELGDIGKKVHTGRSRNDQVLVDLKLFARAEIMKTVEKVKDLFGCPPAEKRTVQGCAGPGLYASAGGYAVIIRPLVRRLCRKPYR